MSSPESPVLVHESVSRAPDPADPDTRAGTGPRITLWLLRLGVVLHLLAAVGQPLFAGLYLGGDFDALGMHELNAQIVNFLALLLIPVTLVYWLVGKGRGWPVLAVLGLFIAEVVQIDTGYTRSLGMHIPLGVGVVTVAVLLAIWVFKPGAKQARRLSRRARRKAAARAGAAGTTGTTGTASAAEPTAGAR